MHMVVHSNVKRFKCEFCGNEYKRAKALKVSFGNDDETSDWIT